jgi:hypothetical protein
MRKINITAALAIVATGLIPVLASAQNSGLGTNYQPRPQTDSERLQNFRAPPSPPTSYPNISGGDRGDPRLNINRDVSLGGNLGAGSLEGNVRFPIPGMN